MAANAGMSHTTIGRIWRTFGLKPHISESFKISPDPQLIEKIRDVVGLYRCMPNDTTFVRNHGPKGLVARAYAGRHRWRHDSGLCPRSPCPRNGLPFKSP